MSKKPVGRRNNLERQFSVDFENAETFGTDPNNSNMGALSPSKNPSYPDFNQAWILEEDTLMMILASFNQSENVNYQCHCLTCTPADQLDGAEISFSCKLWPLIALQSPIHPSVHPSTCPASVKLRIKV